MRACSFVVFLAFLVVGCGGENNPKVYPVSGKVTYNGQPLVGAEVTFMGPKAARAATGKTDAQGVFALSTFGANDGAIAGEHVVTIQKLEVPEFMKNLGTQPMDSGEFEKLKQATAEKGLPTETKSLIPERFSRGNESGLKRTVEAKATNNILIDLTD